MMGLFLIITGVVLMYRVETIIKRPQYNLKIPIEDFLEDITEWVRDYVPDTEKVPQYGCFDLKIRRSRGFQLSYK